MTNEIFSSKATIDHFLRNSKHSALWSSISTNYWIHNALCGVVPYGSFVPKRDQHAPWLAISEKAYWTAMQVSEKRRSLNCSLHKNSKTSCAKKLHDYKRRSQRRKQRWGIAVPSLPAKLPVYLVLKQNCLNFNLIYNTSSIAVKKHRSWI